jgi:hypothetical protein
MKGDVSFLIPYNALMNWNWCGDCSQWDIAVVENSERFRVSHFFEVSIRKTINVDSRLNEIWLIYESRKDLSHRDSLKSKANLTVQQITPTIN